MEWLQTIFFAFLGAASGFSVSGGVFTTLIVIGLLPRFAGKTHTANHVFIYEEMVVVGTIFGTILSVFYPFIKTYEWGNGYELFEQIREFLTPVYLSIYGFFAGIFVGCLALAIAEMLNSIPIFARRAKFRHGIGIVILFMALGKSFGGLLYFFKQLFIYGGL